MIVFEETVAADTRGFMPDLEILAGPYPSKEAVEMLLMMGAIDLTGG